MRHNKLLLKTLYEDFAAHFSWQWLSPPTKEAVLSPPIAEIPWIGYFQPHRAHLISVQSSSSPLCVRGDEQLIILTEYTRSDAILSSKTIPLLATACSGDTLINTLMPYLSEKLAPTFSVHGVFLNIFGKGILLQGPSKLGKSSLALKLLERGHRLIADDVPLFRTQGLRIIGSCAPALQNRLHSRELGIIDVTTLWGPFCIEAEKSLDLIINLTNPIDELLPLLTPQLKKEKWGHLSIPSLSLPFAFNQDSAILVENAIKVAFQCLSANNSYG